MQSKILAYFTREEERLEQAISSRVAVSAQRQAEIACLQKLRGIVRDQMESWGTDLGEPTSSFCKSQL